MVAIEWFPVYGSAYPSGHLIQRGLLHLEGAPCKRVRPEHVMSDDRTQVVLFPRVSECCKKCARIASKRAVAAVLDGVSR